MSVDLKIGGTNLAAGDYQIWAHEATISEDASPTSLADSFGGVGSITASTQTRDDTLLSQGAELEVSFTPGGTRKGIITAVTDSNGNSSLNALTVMATLNRVISAPVITTTLGAALTRYLSLAGLSVTQYSIDSSVASRSVLYPGWKDNCWKRLKELQAIEEIDFNEVDGVIQVLPRTADREIVVTSQSAVSPTVSENLVGKRVETHFYDYRRITNEIVFPAANYDSTYGYTSAPGYHAGEQVITVTPGSPVVTDIPLMASLTSVQQPVCVKNPPGPNYVGPSVYTVLLNGGIEPIDPDEWYRRGGSVVVEILPDTTTLRITVDAGDNIFAAAPFRLAVSSGSQDYSTLRIMGTGIAYSKTRVRQPTSIPDSLTDQDIGTSTDSIFCRTQDQARAQLLLQAHEAGRAVAQLSTTIAETDVAIGLRAGAVIKRPEGNYRVRSASTTANAISLTASSATRLRDLADAFSGKTVADLAALWEGYTMRNFETAPLRQATPSAPARTVLTGYGFGSLGGGGYGG